MDMACTHREVGMSVLEKIALLALFVMVIGLSVIVVGIFFDFPPYLGLKISVGGALVFAWSMVILSYTTFGR